MGAPPATVAPGPTRAMWDPGRRTIAVAPGATVHAAATVAPGPTENRDSIRFDSRTVDLAAAAPPQAGTTGALWTIPSHGGLPLAGTTQSLQPYRRPMPLEQTSIELSLQPYCRPMLLEQTSIEQHSRLIDEHWRQLGLSFLELQARHLL